MLDPGALGTLVIGLDIEQQTDPRRRRRSRAVAPPRRASSIRVALARGLRRAASYLERPAVGEVANA
jgi:hypothetical protein